LFFATSVRKALLLLSLLLPAFALNLSVECSGPCLAYLPAGGALLNYSVDGRELGDLFTKAFLVNISGESRKNALLKLNLTRYSCENPATAFLNNSLETAFFDEFLLVKVNTTASNTTLKLFCSGFNTLRDQASWYGVKKPTLWRTNNLTHNGTRWVVSGLNLLASTVMQLNETHEVELGRENLTVANQSNPLNITVLNKSLELKTYLELPNASYVYMDYGNLTGDNRFFYVVSHGNSTDGNITILDEGLGINATLEFNVTGGVAVADVDNDSVKEVVACANTTEYNLTVLEFGGSGWTYSQTSISCPFASFDPFVYPGVNESVLTFNSTSLVLLLFNKTVEVKSVVLGGIEDIATFDADGDGSSEVAVAFQDGVRLYNVSLPFSITEIDYLGDWENAKLDAWDELLVENGTLGLYSKSEALTTTGQASYFFPESLPVKVELNFTVGGTGNMTLNVSSGNWYYNSTHSSQDVHLLLYPEANNSLWINFSLEAVNSSVEPWIVVNNLTVWFANSSYLNLTNFTAYPPTTLEVNTSIKAGGSWELVGANFSDMFTLDHFLVYLPGGNYSFQLDFPQYTLSMSKPSISASVTTYWINGSAVQGSQNEGNFSGVVGFDTALHLVERRLNLTAYGTVRDYCSYGNYLLYTWGNATLLEWSGSLSEVGNITGNFSECWLTGSGIYLVNSTGGVQIYNYSLTSTGNFTNSSFIVRDIVVTDSVKVWNGTQLATAWTNNSFVVEKDWDGRLFKAQFLYHGSSSTEIVDAPAGDVDGDSLWEKFEGAVFSLVSGVARIFGLPWGSYSSLGRNVSVAFENGTLYTYELNLTTPRIGWFTSFQTNVTSGTGWIALNSTDSFQINVSVTGFIYNETDTLNNFSLLCRNSTYSKEMKMVKYSNHSFTVENTTPPGKYSCSIYPQWSSPLPLTFPSYDFALYSDAQAPVINNVTAPAAISSTVNFNITVNVTEDSEIQSFLITPDKDMRVTISGFTLSEGEYQIYTVTLSINRLAFPVSNITLNISAMDYAGKRSANFTTGNITIYNKDPPTITIPQTAPSDNIQDFATVPLNLSIQSSSDADIDYMNASIWQGSNLQAYNESTNINKKSYTLKLNQYLSASMSDYVVRIVSSDITGHKSEDIINVSRYGSFDKLFSGKWLSSTVGSTQVYWEKEFTSEGIINTITDTDTGMNITDDATFSIVLKTPNKPVDEWYIYNNASTSLKYIKLKYFDSLPPTAPVTEYIYASAYTWGINVSTEPETILVRGERTIGSSEKMCLKICDTYDVKSGTCDSSWVEENCASAGVDEYTFIVSGTNDLLDNILTGTGFFIDKVAIESTSQDEDTGDQISSGLVGEAVITITAPTSRTVEVGSCVDVTYTIKNTGSVSGSISGITASGFYTSEMTYTMLSDISFPYSLGVNSQLQAILSFCPLIAKEFNPSVCVKVGSANKCVTVKITGTAAENKTVPKSVEPENITVSVETFEEEYIVLVNSSAGPLGGVEVMVTYSDGSSENFTTNVFGKVNFVPKLKDFTVKVFYGNETIEKTIEELVEPVGLTLWRILVDLLIIAALLGFGVILDEKML